MTIKSAILRLIAENDEKWSWYQIERGLSARNVDTHGKLMAVIKGMISDNLIVDIPSSISAQPTYKISDAGRELLASYDGGG